MNVDSFAKLKIFKILIRIFTTFGVNDGFANIFSNGTVIAKAPAAYRYDACRRVFDSQRKDDNWIDKIMKILASLIS